MRKTHLVPVLFFLCASVASAQRSAETVLPMVTAPRLASGPVIDGRLDDGQWGRAASIPYFVNVSSWTSPTQATQVYVFYTAAALFVGFDCAESQMSKISGIVSHRDESIFSDDCVEIFMKWDHGERPYYHLAANPAGTRYDAINRDSRQPDESWNPEWRIAVSRRENGWQAEMEIPFAELGAPVPVPGTRWRINFCREEKPSSEVSCWSSVKGGFHEPDNFGTLLFGDENVPTVRIHQFLAWPNGLIERDGEVSNTGASAVDVRLETTVTSGGSRRSFVLPISVDPGSAQKFRLSDSITDEGKLTAVIEASVKGVVFFRTLRPFEVPPVRSRLSQISNRLRVLEDSIVAIPPDASAWSYANLEALKARRDLIQKSARFTSESTPGQIQALVSSLDLLDRGVAVAEMVLQVHKLRIASPGTEFVVWAADPWTQLKPYDYPESVSPSPEARAAAYRGENVYAAFNVTNLTDSTQDLRVEITPPALESGETASRNSVAVHTCAFVKEDAQSAGLVGDALPLADQAYRLMVPPFQTGQVFLIWRTGGLSAAEYSTSVSIQPTVGGPVQTAKLHVVIHPLDLPDEPRPWLCTWGGILNVSWAKPDPQTYLRDAVEHGVNVFLISPAAARPELDKDGKIVKPPDYTTHDKLVAAYKPYGMIAGIYSIGIEYDRWAKRAGIAYMSPAYRKGFIAWFRGWVAHLKSLGLEYKDMAFEIVDEPASKEKFRMHLDIGRLVREADPQAKVLVTVNFSEAPRLREISEVVDIWVPVGRVLEDDIARQVMKDSGKEMWVYVCSGDSKRLDPVGYYRFLAWQAFRYDLNGWGFFAHMWWGEKPWESGNTTGKRLATFSTVYPGSNGPVTSRRWEAYWKGHEDFRALHLLKRLVGEARKAGVSSDLLEHANGVLEEARTASVVLSEMQNKSTRSRSEHLAALRNKIAEATIALSQAVKTGQ